MTLEAGTLLLSTAPGMHWRFLAFPQQSRPSHIGSAQCFCREMFSGSASPRLASPVSCHVAAGPAGKLVFR